MLLIQYVPYQKNFVVQCLRISSTDMFAPFRSAQTKFKCPVKNSLSFSFQRVVI